MSATYGVGIDVGGTKIAAGLVDEAGVLIRREEAPSSPEEPEQMLTSIVELANRLDPHRTAPVGAALAGQLDRDRERMVFSPNIAWRDVPMRALLQDRLGRPVRVENDADAAAYGELRHGAGRGALDLVVVTLGTGVGGGIFVDGRPVRGGGGMGAELGHVIVQPDGRRCGCGLDGCLEAYSSGTALRRAGQQAVSDGAADTGLWQRCGGDPEALTTRDIVAVAAQGDELAGRLLAEVGEWLGRGLCSICAVVDPERIVVGGGLAMVGEPVLTPARETYARLMQQGHRAPVEVVAAALGNDGGMIGAAALARESAA